MHAEYERQNKRDGDAYLFIIIIRRHSFIIIFFFSYNFVIFLLSILLFYREWAYVFEQIIELRVRPAKKHRVRASGSEKI